MPVRILVTDDNEIVRIGVRALIKSKHDWEVCGDATNGEEAILKAIELAPDVVILDVTMPVINGFQTAAEIRRVAPATKIVFFSVHEIPAIAREVGADAFVSKSSAALDLVATIERLMSLPQTPRTSAVSA